MQRNSTIIDYWYDEDPAVAGWYIFSLEADGTCYDAIGPYDSEVEALLVMNATEAA